jgi:hypothetical protein
MDNMTPEVKRKMRDRKFLDKRIRRKLQEASRKANRRRR